MKHFDRFVLCTLTLGVWLLITLIAFAPFNSTVTAHGSNHDHDAYEIYGVAKTSHDHYGEYADYGHDHDYADSYHSHSHDHYGKYADSSHSHSCSRSGSFITCY